MPIVQDELWRHPGNPGMIVVAGHAHVSEDGRLCLGYGEAKEAVKRIPGIEEQCGEVVRKAAVDGKYGFLPVRPSRPEQYRVGFGLFQTQIQPDQPAETQLIKYSMELLRQYTLEHTEIKIRMDFPGLQAGLSVEEVTPILVPLPQNVTICHQEQVLGSTSTAFIGFKTLFIQIEGLLKEGRLQLAIDYLVEQGYDIQAAIEQVEAVQRMLSEHTEHEREATLRWRNTRYAN